MKIDVLTLFPNMYENFLNESIIKKAITNKLVTIQTHNIRDYSKDKHKKVDDTSYGGGSGMLLKCQPIFDAIKELKKKDSKIILMDPAGKQYNQKIANELKEEKHIILISGHYEGYDERIKTICDLELSIGDYVLTGGELPSMVIIDSVVRLVDGVIDSGSIKEETFNDNTLEYPQYTKPRDFAGLRVPEVLLSGDHEKIKEWRKEQSLEKTIQLRPDLLNKKYILIKSCRFKKGVLKLKEGYSFNPKNNAKNESLIDVRKIEIYDSEYVSRIIGTNIKKRLENLLKMILSVETEEDVAKVIDESTRMKNIVNTKYRKLLNDNIIELELKRIDFLLTKIKIKKIELDEKEFRTK